MGLDRGDFELAQLNLAMGPGQFEGALHAVKIVILIGQGERRVP